MSVVEKPELSTRNAPKGPFDEMHWSCTDESVISNERENPELAVAEEGLQPGREPVVCEARTVWAVARAKPIPLLPKRSKSFDVEDVFSAGCSHDDMKFRV